MSPTPRRALAALALPLLLAPVAPAQGSAADYERARTQVDRTRGLVRNRSIDATWLADGAWLHVVVEDEAGERRSRLVEAATGDTRDLPTEAELRAAIGAAAGDAAAGAGGGDLFVGCDGAALFTWGGDPATAWRHDLDDARATALDLAEAAPLLLEPRAGRPRSTDGGARCPLRLVNATDRALTVTWVPRWGEPRAYGTLAPGEVFRQSTYAGHAWVLLDAEGARVAAFVAEAGRPLGLVDARALAVGAGGPAGGGGAATGDDPATTAEPPGRVALVRGHDVWLRDEATGDELPLTEGGTAAAGFGGPVHTSPDGRHAVVLHTVDAQTRRVHVVEAAPDDQLQPKLHDWPYLKPGDRIAHRRPHLFDLERGVEVPVDDALFGTPWSITRLAWHPDSSAFHFVYDQRGHQVQRVVAVEAATGVARTLVEEAPDTFVDYSQKTWLERLESVGDDGAPRLELLWASERDGWNHLYLVDATSGETRQVTRGEWVVRDVLWLDTPPGGPRTATLEVSGIFPDQDPYHLHHVRVDLDTGALVHLTRGDGTHRLDWSPDRSHYVARWSRVDHPPVHELRRASDGALVAELARADWSALLATGWRTPERFVAKGRDGVTDIWGLIRRPSTFDPDRSYPVIEHIYAGPHGAFVPKAFGASSGPARLAELGFVVVQIDGMGTNHRGKRFHDVAWKNLGDAGFPDRILWLRAAAAHEPAMDLTRVGIYGGSAGGQSALRALLAHGDVYHAAVADCGCHDNRIDKIWWNEAWMGWPIGPHYEQQSNVTNAHRLEGDLLLVVGEVDRNVDPASTMQVVDALIDADKDFELLVMPGVGHGAMGTAYGTRRMRDFFVRKLHGVEPRRE